MRESSGMGSTYTGSHGNTSNNGNKLPAHKPTLSMPKLSSHSGTGSVLNSMSNSKYQTAVNSGSVAIDKSSSNNLGSSNTNNTNNINNNHKSSHSQINHKSTNSEITISALMQNSKNHSPGLTKKNSRKSLNTRENNKCDLTSYSNNTGGFRHNDNNANVNNLTNLNNVNKYIKTYTSDISKLKKKVSNLVSDSNHNHHYSKNKKTNKNSQSGSGIMSSSSAIHNYTGGQNTNLMSTINIGNNSTSNNIDKKRKDNCGSTNNSNCNTNRNKSLTRDTSDNQTNSIRAILQRELFRDENDRVLKKNMVDNVKVRNLYIIYIII